MHPAVPVSIAVLAQALVAWAGARIGGGTTVPSHWNVHGVADATGTRLGVGGMFVVLTFTLGVLLPALEGADPRVRADPLTLRRYRQVGIGVLVFFVSVHAMIAFGADVGRLLFAPLGVGFTLLGAAMRDIAPNGLMGFRTGWTLSSDLAWRRAHREAAWAFGVGGALTLLAGLWRPEAAFAVLMMTTLGAAVVITARSRRWYAQDPDRRPLRWW